MRTMPFPLWLDKNNAPLRSQSRPLLSWHDETSLLPLLSNFTAYDKALGYPWIPVSEDRFILIHQGALSSVLILKNRPFVSLKTRWPTVNERSDQLSFKVYDTFSLQGRIFLGIMSQVIASPCISFSSQKTYILCRCGRGKCLSKKWPITC